jgi:subtilase family serine protease
VVDTMTVSGNGVDNAVTLIAPSGSIAYSRAQIRAAYGISALGLDGTGQTIAVVDAYDDPSIFQSLDAFDSQFGLTSDQILGVVLDADSHDALIGDLAFERILSGTHNVKGTAATVTTR